MIGQQQLCRALKKLFKKLYKTHRQVQFSLLIGKDNQGKQTLLSQSDFMLLDACHSDAVSIYVHANQVILLLSERWLMSSTRLLEKQIKLINQCHRHVWIQSILFVINLQELVNDQSFAINQRLQAHINLSTWLSDSLGQAIPCHIIMTHADSITGFCDYFSQTTNHAEPTQIFGLSFDFQPQKTEKHMAKKLFQLAAYLQQMVVDKLHYCRATIKRQLIREFPQQFSAYHRALTYCLKAVSQPNLPVVGLFFVSSVQQGTSFDPLNKRIKQEYSLTLPEQHNLASNHKPYFVQNTLSHILNRHQPEAASPFNKHVQTVAIAVSILLGLISLYGIKRGFEANTELDTISQLLISHEQNLSQPDHRNTALVALTQANDRLEKLTDSMFYPASLVDLKQQLHHKSRVTLHEQFLPVALNTLTKTIRSSASSVSDKFNALKVYRMLGSKSQYRREAVLNWFNQHWQSLGDADFNNNMHLLKNALKPPFQPVSLDEQLIRDTQNYLNALPDQYLYYKLAKDQFPQQRQAIQLPGFSLYQQTLPVYFTKTGFEQIKPRLPDIAKRLADDHWVLNKKPVTNLADMIEKSYCYAYRDWWKHFIHKTRPMTPNSFRSIEEITTTLHQNKSFTQFLLLVQAQTSPASSQHGQYFNRLIAPSFAHINLISQTAVTHLDQNMGELGKFVGQINLLDDRQAMVFDLTKARFVHPDNIDPLSVIYQSSQRLPEPLKSWTKIYADETWFQMLKDSQNWLNQQWQARIVSFYQQKLANRFPINEKGVIDINPDDFDAFFSPNGHLFSFINKEIKPFLHTEQAQWQLKEVNGFHLPFSQKTINHFMQANIISNMFFAQGGVSNLRFSLEKVALDPSIASLNFHLDNQAVTDSLNNRSLSKARIHWPQQHAKIRLETLEGNHFELEASGPWALHHIVHNLSLTPNPQHPEQIAIDLNVNGYSGRYVLSSNNLINPLTPGILEQFVIERTLFS